MDWIRKDARVFLVGFNIYEGSSRGVAQGAKNRTEEAVGASTPSLFTTWRKKLAASLVMIAAHLAVHLVLFPIHLLAFAAAVANTKAASASPERSRRLAAMRALAVHTVRICQSYPAGVSSSSGSDKATVRVEEHIIFKTILKTLFLGRETVIYRYSAFYEGCNLPCRAFNPHLSTVPLLF